MPNNKRLIAEIFDGENLVMIIDNNLLNAEFGALDRGSLTNVVDWGIYANRGSVSFIDKDGFFNNQNINSTEILEYTVRFYLSKNKKTLISTFNIEQAVLNEETREVVLELVSPLLKLEREKITQSIYLFNETNIGALVSNINSHTQKSKIGFGADTRNLASVIGCTYIGVDSVWNVMSKICQASMSRIIETEDGTPQITSSFPNRKAIVIKPNNIINIENSAFVRIKNAYIDVTKRQKVVKEVLEGSTQSFSIEWDGESEIIGESGLTISSLEKEESNSKTSIYANGSIKIKTPYKLFSLYADLSNITRRYTVYDLDSLDVSRESENNVSIKFSSNRYISNETDIVANFERQSIYTSNVEPELVATYLRVVGGTIKFPITTFLDDGTYSLSIDMESSEKEQIQSNDLVQDISYAGEVELGQHILNEVKRRYSRGIECFEIECLFNSYYYDDGNLAYDGDDLSGHFTRYDVVIPYITKKGRIVPLRVNENGEPKKFRIIGISYYYDGLLKQKLQLQEERYDID